MGGFLDARIFPIFFPPKKKHIHPEELGLQHPPQAIIKQRVWDEAFDDVVAQPKGSFWVPKKMEAWMALMQEKWKKNTNYLLFLCESSFFLG